jgi:hypothetical protein
MIVEKLMMPYFLVSHHTLVHATLLVLYLSVFLIIDNEDDCSSFPAAKRKSCENLNKTYNFMIWMHAGCFFLHFLIKYFEMKPYLKMLEKNMYDVSSKFYQHAFLPKFLLTAKIFLYFGSVTIA